MIASLARIEERLAPMKDHEARIVALERGQFKTTAVVGVGGMVLGHFTGSLSNFLAFLSSLLPKG